MFKINFNLHLSHRTYVPPMGRVIQVRDSLEVDLRHSQWRTRCGHHSVLTSHTSHAAGLYRSPVSTHKPHRPFGEDLTHTSSEQGNRTFFSNTLSMSTMADLISATYLYNLRNSTHLYGFPFLLCVVLAASFYLSLRI